MTSAEANRIYDEIKDISAAIGRIEGTCSACGKIVMGNGNAGIDSRVTAVETEMGGWRRWRGVLPGIVSAVISGVVVGLVLLLSGVGQ